MPELVRPTLEVHRSFLAAMAEFRGEGRGGVDDNSMIGLENREFGGTWDTLEGFAAYVQKIRRDADEDSRVRPGGCPAPPFGPVLVTCDTDNVASRKVIEANSGRYEDTRGNKLRYWIPTG